MKLKYLLYSITVVTAFSACKKDKLIVPDDEPYIRPAPPANPYEPDNSFKIIAYYSGSRTLDSIDDAKFKMITHLNYAFLYPNNDGTLKPLEQAARFYEVVDKAKANGVKVAASLAGPEAVYATIAVNAAVRTKLISNIVDFVLQNNLDGVDMDWEYPRANKSQDLTFALLMSELADSLHKWHKYLSAAVTPAVYSGAVRDGVTAEAISKIDFLNIMVYDGLNWDVNDPLQHSSYAMAETSLDIWQNIKGLPKAKTVLGIPAYGKNQSNVAMFYRDLINAGANPASDSYEIEGVAYHYNGIQLVKQKALLAKDRANGVMIWEFYQDANGPNSLIKAINDALGRSY